MGICQGQGNRAVCLGVDLREQHVLLPQVLAHGLPQALQHPQALFDVVQGFVLPDLCNLPLLQSQVAVNN